MLVVGGGIYGLTIAYDAAQRGLAVALVERGDFGAATSFNHLKTIHGGLRYLQSADLRRMRESNRERRAFGRIAPRFIAPLPFAMPTGSSMTRRPLAMRAALALDAIVGTDRNEGVDASRHLPAGRIITGAECRELFDGAVPSVASAAMWHDYQTTNGDRLTLSFAEAASGHGAVLANYTEACSPVWKGDRIAGITARDRLAGQELEIRARVLVNAAGPWSATMLDRVGACTRGQLLKAMNLVTSRPARKAALVARMRGGRSLVMLPWQGRTLIGTSESADERQADDQDAKRTEVDGFVRDINETFPALGLKASEITLVHRGIVPAVASAGRLTPLSHSRIVDHGVNGGRHGLITIIGVKYTTARSVAERAVDQVFRNLGRAPVQCRTAETLLPGAGLDDRDAADPVLHAIRHQMAHSLTDVVIRRTGFGAAGHPGEGIVNDIASRMQTALGWSQDRKQREIEAVQSFYEIV